MTKVEELSHGIIYSQLREIGIEPKTSRELEKLYWEEHDRVNPLNPFERSFKDFVDGKSTIKYNEVNLLENLIQ